MAADGPVDASRLDLQHDLPGLRNGAYLTTVLAFIPFLVVLVLGFVLS